ncbi:MAG: hypothetical protein BWY36_00071 [Candidatus Diapherotrites archaeon ADurb.Bin253]|jgi:hypothetical protein|nr:hypothetical protein [Candidatus Pacearchaeota archaeon]OQA69148.1 MAG: hypothetical protein BWY36_00071 [Candidatus Diapherotrites archaeon ADurb.Bin253]HNZ51991.1 hypothetical protein [Candidatus Pacearchaeota archaeon]HOC96651.1 hypothetical protein [Candidatus Pacearchaeota archaeon]HOF43917.1 hypothetical protein [Candidatus Pacearchaeota archaeon]
MPKHKRLNNLKYSVSLIPTSHNFSIDNSVGNISRLHFKRGISYFDFKVFYNNDEFYGIKYHFKDGHYKKSYFFKEGDITINKKNILVNKQQDIKELNFFLIEHFYNILENRYKLSKDSKLSFDYLTEDLRDILRFIS